MSKVEYIISCRNPSKVLPDTLYFCNSKQGIINATSSEEFTWDKDPTLANVFTSVEPVACTIDCLRRLGFTSIQVLQKIIKFEPVDTESFTETITKQKIKDILNTIPDDDIDFLVKHADLDLTSVT